MAVKEKDACLKGGGCGGLGGEPFLLTLYTLYLYLFQAYANS